MVINNLKPSLIIIDEPDGVDCSQVKIDVHLTECASTFELQVTNNKAFVKRIGDFVYIGHERKIWRLLSKEEKKHLEELIKEQENDFIEKRKS